MNKGVHAVAAGFIDAALRSRAKAMKTVYTKGEAESAPLQAGRQSALLLERGELELRYYAPRGLDSQTPHDRDEVYFVASGSGLFFCDGNREAFQTGDAIFVPAYAEHRFESFTDDFAVWVVFYGPVGGSVDASSATDPARRSGGAMKTVYAKGEAESAPLQAGQRSALLLERGELELLYYTPRGRDSQTPHDRDEVYFVASGSGVFFCDGSREAFQTGDTIFVPAYAEHRFESFTDDFAAWVVFYGPVGGSPDAKSSADPTRQADPPKPHYDPPAKDMEYSSDSGYEGGDFGGK